MPQLLVESQLLAHARSGQARLLCIALFRELHNELGRELSLRAGHGSRSLVFFFQAEDGIRDHCVTGVQTCALPIYVEAAIASGTSFPLILWRHIVPNTLPPLLVQGTFVAAGAMITEAILSFIGAGTPPRSEERRVGRESRSWGCSMVCNKSKYTLER